MKNFRVFFLYCLLYISILSSCTAPSATVTNQDNVSPLKNPQTAILKLQQKIDQILQDPLLSSANVGMKVVSIITKEILYEQNADKLYPPASTIKLATSAAALVKLTPNFRFHTTLYMDSLSIKTFADSSIPGDIYLKGRGDPTFSTDDLEEMTDKFIEMGIKHIQGDIVIDETHFDSVRWGEGWMWDDGPVGGFWPTFSALSINRNGILVHVSPGDKIGDSVKIHLEPPTGYLEIINEATTVSSRKQEPLSIKRQGMPVEANILTISGTIAKNRSPVSRQVDVVEPALYCGTLLKELLAQKSITLQGTVRYGEVPKNGVDIIDHISPPLFLTVREMNKSSDNLIAELLLKTIGAEVKGPPGTGKKGISVVNEFLNEIGLDTTQYMLVDGSGVSRYNLTNASMLTELLVYMFRNFEVMPEYLVSLPTGGVDGTLNRRMKGMASESVLRAKTGTMRGISTLAGYTMTSDGEILAFAILMNNYVGYHNPRRFLQDKIGDVLTKFSRKIGN